MTFVVIAGIVASAVTASCSLLTSFDDLVTLASADAALPNDAASDASVSDASTGIAVVQIGSVDEKSHNVDFPHDTTAGNFLVAMEPVTTTMPNGSGWQTVLSSDNTDVMYFWPNNPGGLKSFTGPTFNTVILIELSGVPENAFVDFEKDTGGRGPSISALSLTGGAPSAAGELVLLYLDSTAGVPAPLDGWSSLGTDNQNNFAWWKISDQTAPFATTTISPSSPTTMLMIAFRSAQ